MRLHPIDPFSLVVGLGALLIGVAALAGQLDGRALGQGWLVPGLVVVLGIGLLASTLRMRQRARRDREEEREGEQW
jgi:hypothetical protein